MIHTPDVNTQYVLKAGFRQLKKDPDRLVREIFCQYASTELAPSLGDPFIEKIVAWVKKTDFPVYLGFETTDQPPKVPSTTVSLGSCTPKQLFIGDRGENTYEELKPYERQVVVAAFNPAALVLNSDSTGWLLTLPDSMSDDDQSLFTLSSNVQIRDAKGQLFNVSWDEAAAKTLITKASTPILQLDGTKLELVTSFVTSSYQSGSAVYNCRVDVISLGRDRNETTWISHVVTWILLRYRIVMEQAFGMGQLSAPMISDLVRDETWGDLVWQRSQTLTSTCLFTWKEAQNTDIVAMLLEVDADRA